MTKTAWQATAFISTAMAFLLGGFALNTKNQLEAAYAQMRNRPAVAPVACPEQPATAINTTRFDDGTGTHPDYQSAQLIREIESDGQHRCIGGQLFRIQVGKWEQVGNCPKFTHE